MWKSRNTESSGKKMAYKNTGSLSRNDTKQMPNHPDLRGNAKLCCPNCQAETDYWVSGWYKTSRNDGRQFISLGLRDKNEKADMTTPQQMMERVFPNAADDIDF
jgi:hypothetical protein